MKINFVLPSFPLYPGGGHKIIYEYANLFAEKGYDIIIYHVGTLPFVKYKMPHLLRVIRGSLFWSDSRPTWFKLNDRILTKNIPLLKDEYVRDADIIISTMWVTALEAYKLSNKKGKKINLIQGYELWIGNNKELLYSSYCLPITHIVIADYLADIVEGASGKRPQIVYNGIDNNVFNLQVRIEERNPHSVSMLYSEQDIKGSKYAVEAFNFCKEQYKDLYIELFGVYKKSPLITANWINYTRNPDNLASIYNSTSIFFSPSNTEGWALPPAEALFCGCALICTNIGGHQGYAIDEETALLVEPRNSKDMADKLCKLLASNDKRIALAQKGNEFIQKFTWEQAFNDMLSVIIK